MHDKPPSLKGGQPEPAQAKAPVLPEPLHDIPSVSRVLRDLLSAKKAIDGAENKEGREAAWREEDKIMRGHGLAGIPFDDKHCSPYEFLLEKAVTEVLESVNTTDPRGFFATLMQRATSQASLKTGDRYAVTIIDEDDALGSNELMKAALETFFYELEKSKSPDTYKAHIRIVGDVMGIQIDHGKHKGYIAVFCPDNDLPPVVLFRHFEHGQGEFSKNRVPFVKNALSTIGMRRWTEGRGDKSCKIFGIRFCNNENWRFVLSSAVRLSRAVKDLDLTLRDESSIKRASMLFMYGVTNMTEFLSILSRRTDISKYPAPLTDKEKDTYRYCLRSIGFIESEIRSVKSAHAYIREVKDLNFGILECGTRLQLLVINRRMEGGMVLKREVAAAFREIGEKVMDMARGCDSLVGRVRGAGYAKKAATIVRRYENMLSDCESWVLDEKETMRVMGMFADRGGMLELASVDTVEELVRLMHSDLVSTVETRPVAFFSHGKDAEVCLLDESVLLKDGFVCFGLEPHTPLKDLEPYKALKSVIGMLSDGDNFQNDGQVVALIGSHSADLSMPMGKHYAEITADLDDKNGCHVVGLRYIDTEYSGAQARKRYLKIALGRLGFDVLPEDSESRVGHRLIKAVFRTEDRERWRTAFTELARLVLSARNLDLRGDFEPEWMADVFFKGFTEINISLLFFRNIADAAPEEAARGYRRIISNPSIGSGDRTAFTGMFIENLGYKPSSIIPLLKDFSVAELDTMMNDIFTLESRAKERHEQKKAGQLNRLMDKMDKLVTEKEHSESGTSGP
jgi:hypothetical protein